MSRLHIETIASANNFVRHRERANGSLYEPFVRTNRYSIPDMREALDRRTES